MQKLEITSLPKSLAEAVSLGHNLYFTGVQCRQGHSAYRYVSGRACSACVKAKVKRAATVGGGNARRWAAKTMEQLENIYAKRKDYYYRTQEDRRLEKKKSYATLIKDPQRLELWRQKASTYRENTIRLPEVSNPEVKRRYKQTTNGKTVSRINDAKRRASKIHRTPVWITADDLWMMEQAYELAALRTKLFGFSWHVDHVIPLQGKFVSGLHVPTNLQVIPWRDNVSKSNKYLPA